MKKKLIFLLLFAFALRLYFALMYQQFPVEYDAAYMTIWVGILLMATVL